MIDLKLILAPTDFSENSQAGIQYACELSRKFNAEIRLISVVDDFGVYAMEMELGAYAEGGFDLAESERRAAKRLEELEFPDDVVSRVKRETLMGAPAEGICRYATENDVDVIVLSTHGRSGLARLLMGSVAEHVVRASPCPVLTVRPTGHQFFHESEQAKSEG